MYLTVFNNILIKINQRLYLTSNTSFSQLKTWGFSPQKIPII